MASISQPPSPSSRRLTGSAAIASPLTSMIGTDESVSAAMMRNRKRLRSCPRVELGAKRARRSSGNNSERPRLPSNASNNGASSRNATRIGRTASLSRRQSGPMAYLPTISRTASMSNINLVVPPESPSSLPLVKRHLSETPVVMKFKPSPSFDKRCAFPLAWSSKQELFYADDNSVRRQFPNKENRSFIQKMKAAGMAVGIFGAKKRECLAIISHEDQSLTVWRLKTAKRLYRFGMKSDKMTSITWHESLISVGLASGKVEHFDVSGPKTQKLAQMGMNTLELLSGLVTCVAWNSEGTVFAAGDASGNVGVWKRDGERLVLGDRDANSVERRIRHGGAITTLTWFPSDPNRLFTGDNKGLIRIWSLNGQGSTSDSSIARAQYGASGLTAAERLQCDSVIQSVHISRQLPELFIVFGSYASDHIVRKTQENTVSAYSLRDMSHLKEVTLYKKVAFSRNHDDPSFCGSALSGDETKLALAIPELGEIRIWNAWGPA
ncbi:WD40-repeat-containing domain protein [Mucidula mucida]|nr:WD40-repeat-containing domain protein [Mucidula mucida]